MMVAWLLVGLMLSLSVAAFLRAPAGARLPMQWGLAGQVMWRAPRFIAVLLAPVLAILILAVVASFGSEAGWVAVTIAAVFLVAHAAHLYFALRDVSPRQR